MSVACRQGHVNVDGTLFCATCGLAIGSSPAPAQGPATPTLMPAQTPGLPAPRNPGSPMPPHAYYPPQPAPQNGMGVAALVLGILSLLCFGFVLGVLAIIFGGIGISRVNAGRATNKGQATWGLVLGIIGLVGWSIWLLAQAGSGARY